MNEPFVAPVFQVEKKAVPLDLQQQIHALMETERAKLDAALASQCDSLERSMMETMNRVRASTFVGTRPGTAPKPPGAPGH